MTNSSGVGAKRGKLASMLSAMGRVAIAISGGKDSFYLARTAIRRLGNDAVTLFFGNTPFTSSGARNRIEFCKKKLGHEIMEIGIDLFGDERMKTNPNERCYLCKQMLFNRLIDESRRQSIPHLLDGSTLSDLSEHRPGRRALEELDIASPLADCGITSEEIAVTLCTQGFPGRFVASSTCLATRFPYGHRLRKEEMQVIGQLEDFLLAKGLHPVRVRHIENGIRIETPINNASRLLHLRYDLLELSKSLGLRFVTLDLGGIKRGSWD